MLVAMIFAWNVLEIIFLSYVGWLAAGHYWANFYCSKQLFGKCALHTQGLIEKLSASYFYFTTFTHSSSNMAIGHLRQWYNMNTFLCLTMIITLIIYVFCVHQRLHKLAFFTISILSPRHLVLYVTSEILQYFAKCIYNWCQRRNVVIRQDPVLPEPKIVKTPEKKLKNRKLSTRGGYKLKIEEEGDSMTFRGEYPARFEIAQIKQQAIDYIPDSLFEINFLYETIEQTVPSVEFNSLLGNFRFQERKLKDLEQKYADLLITAKQLEQQKMQIVAQADEFEQISIKASSKLRDYAQARVQAVQQMIRPAEQNQGILDGIKSYFKRDRVQNQVRGQNELRDISTSMGQSGSKRNELEVAPPSASHVHEQDHLLGNGSEPTDNLEVLDSDNPTRINAPGPIAVEEEGKFHEGGEHEPYFEGEEHDRLLDWPGQGGEAQLRYDGIYDFNSYSYTPKIQVHHLRQ